MPKNVQVDIPIKKNGKRHPSGKVHDFIGQNLFEGLQRRGQARVVKQEGIDDMTVKELKEVAKKQGLTGYSTMRKKELKEALTTKELKEDYLTK